MESHVFEVNKMPVQPVSEITKGLNSILQTMCSELVTDPGWSELAERHGRVSMVVRKEANGIINP